MLLQILDIIIICLKISEKKERYPYEQTHIVVCKY